MKIALCISGQPRTWKRCYQSWFDAVSHLGEVDVFYHMWNFNTLPNFAAGFLKTRLPDVTLAPHEIMEIYNTLKPTDHIIDGPRDFPKPNVTNPIAWWTRSQFYGLKRCAFLKREYEIRNNFEYDIVLRIRTDLLLNYKLPYQTLQPNMMYTCVNYHDPEYNTFRIGDTFYYANSYTYDLMSNFYDALDYIDASHVMRDKLEYPPELAFYFYMKSMGINNTSTDARFKIARTEEYNNIKGTLDAYESL